MFNKGIGDCGIVALESIRNPQFLGMLPPLVAAFRFGFDLASSARENSRIIKAGLGQIFMATMQPLFRLSPVTNRFG